MNLESITPCCRRMLFVDGERSERWFYSGHYFDADAMATRNGKHDSESVELGDSFERVSAVLERAGGFLYNMGSDSPGICDGC